MAKARTAAFIWMALGILNANGANESDLSKGVDKLCAHTGLQRVGEVRLIKTTPYAGLNYWVRVPLLVEGRKHFYSMHLDKDFRVCDFQPDGWPFIPGGLIEYPPGYDTYREPKSRNAAITAVEHLNSIRKERTYGRPAVQKVGSDLLVTYQWTSHTRTKDGDLVQDACLSFVVTSRGTIYAQTWGFWPTSGKFPILRRS
jgi:hypothetical protein